MSSRAIRRLRQEHVAADERQELIDDTDGDNVEVIVAESANSTHKERQRAFRLMMADDSSTSDSSTLKSSDGTECAVDEEENKVPPDYGIALLSKSCKNTAQNYFSVSENDEPSSPQVKAKASAKKCIDGEVEDLDAILSEFRSESVAKERNSTLSRSTGQEHLENILLENLRVSALDLDNAMRRMLRGDGTGAGEQELEGIGRTRRAEARNRRFLFGKPRPHWTRPPTLLGGGIGMDVVVSDKQIDHALATALDEEEHFLSNPCDVDKERKAEACIWYTFVYSDTYAKTLVEYNTLVKPSGDVNQLATFLADHPYCVEATLQLAMVLHHTQGNSARGTELLRRVLYVYECAMASAFSNSIGGKERDGLFIRMDADRDENKIFFSALFRMIQVSTMTGCIDTSLALSRVLLSLDPSDPMGVLLTMDYFALADVSDQNNYFVIDLVKSSMILIRHKEKDCSSHICQLADMPNWAFSYALALRRLERAGLPSRRRSVGCQSNTEERMTPLMRADDALKTALLQYPIVVPFLIEKNGVDVHDRSCRADWQVVLNFFRNQDRNLRAAPNADASAADHVISIFVQRCHKLWASDDVLRWLYESSVDLMEEHGHDPNLGLMCELEGKTQKRLCAYPRALKRYLRADPSDFEDSFKTLPAEANVFDEALIVPALAMDQNGRRLWRGRLEDGRNHRVAARADEIRGMQPVLLGNGQVVIDPDDPLVSVFLRSFLPWARVDGVPRS